MKTVSKVSYFVCCGLDGGKTFFGCGMTAGRGSKLGLTDIYSILVGWGIGWGTFWVGTMTLLGETMGAGLKLIICWFVGLLGIMYFFENAGKAYL